MQGIGTAGFGASWIAINFGIDKRAFWHPDPVSSDVAPMNRFYCGKPPLRRSGKALTANMGTVWIIGLNFLRHHFLRNFSS